MTVFGSPPLVETGRNFCATTEFQPIEMGKQVLRLASSADDIAAAQRLRYRVFYDELGARPDAKAAATRLDVDAFDGICEHLIVEDTARPDGERVVGTYRFMRREHARVAGGFYTAHEFDVSPLINRPGAVMELGRSCVDINYRDRSTMQLLWRGIAEYVMTHRIEVMFGCGSLSGTDPDRHALALSYLYYNHLPPEDLRVRALPERYVEMRRVPPDTIDARRALVALPPLLKGYLRAGAFIGEGAVIDEQFNTIDICVIVKTDLITDRYTRRYDLAG
jgi:L-ornithine Nalpha-acyltransferase